MDKLTRRQAEVVRLLVAGQRPAEIAQTLCVSRRMVYGHAAAARARTGMETTQKLMLRAASEQAMGND